jgi:signal transduction histidine kinase/serine/threonine protein kinase/Tfp pilus assembly protein PilF
MIIDSRYQVLESLGTGLWATVYKVEDIRTGNIYALKFFQQLDANDLYEKFTPEDMHHITQIEHPNLVHVVDFGNVGNHIYYIYHYSEGQSLKSYKFKPSNIELLYDIVVQICYALHALHTQDIIHKDLKPDNVIYQMVNGQPEVKVLDYGFTKIDLQKDHQKVTGSLPYIAPEVFLGHGAVQQSDFYSLGVTLYRLTTGSFPFSLEQISALIAGEQQHFFPKFPREINPNVPQSLEKFILKLLEKNPEDRFNNVGEIITYINRTQLKQYPFSIQWSVVNYLKFNSYIVRENYTHQLLEYLPNIMERNGLMLSLIGGDGQGKSNILSLLHYHLLNGDQFVFDYTCTRQHHDPFYALIKEFHQSMFADDSRFSYDLSHISQKFQKYIYESEDTAKILDVSSAEVKLDFESVKNYAIHLSDEKPLVFIIRHAHHLTKQTIDFLNYCANDISKKRIFILLSFNDYSKVTLLKHSVILKIQPLTFEEIKHYTTRLLKQHPPEAFIHQLEERSAGNPDFLRDILIDLTQKKLIWGENRFHFDYDFADYKLPQRLLQSIYTRMSHLTEATYKYMMKLAIVCPPLTKDLIRFVLGISDHDLFSLLADGINNEILIKKGEHIFFSYIETRERLISEGLEEDKIHLSKQVLRFFEGKAINNITVCKGVIENAYWAEDYDSIRQFRLRLIELLDRDSLQDKAFDEICNIIELDFSHKINLPLSEIIKDLVILQEKAELTGNVTKAIKLLRSIHKLPDIYEKYFTLGTLYLQTENHKSALDNFQKALKLSFTGIQKVKVLLYMTQLYQRIGDMKSYGEALDVLKDEPMTEDLHIFYIDRLALYQNRTVSKEQAIQTLEDFLSQTPSIQHAKSWLRLGSLHNNLGYYYTIMKAITEANTHYQAAMKIWEKLNTQSRLGLIWNNVGDLALIQGDTQTCLKYFHCAQELAGRLDLKRIESQSLVNLGETYIKLGDFQIAESYLLQAKRISRTLEDKPFWDAIHSNIALAKSKVNDFDNYSSFIMSQEPDLAQSKIKSLNPLVKTYFYYLYEVGQIKKIQSLINKNAHIKFHSNHEEEFFYNIQSLVSVLQNDHNGALQNISLAMDYAQIVKNEYARCVLLNRMIESLIALNEVEKARDTWIKAQKIVKHYKYQYWQSNLAILDVKINLLIEDIPLRKILRDLLKAWTIIREKRYFLLEVESLGLLTQIYHEMKDISLSKMYFDQLQKQMQTATNGIPPEDRESYLNLHYGNVSKIEQYKKYMIVSRSRQGKEKWNDLLYSLLRLQNVERIKFFIDKSIQKMISPYQYKILLKQERFSDFSVFLEFNCEKDNLLSAEHRNYIDQALESDIMLHRKINEKNLIFVPLRIKTAKVGCMILADDGELDFNRHELNMIRTIRMHLNTILIRIQEFAEMNQKMSLMNKLMEISRHLLGILDIQKLEQEIVSDCMDFVGSSRGFLIKRDAVGNYVYSIGLDSDKKFVTNYTMVSKTVLSEVQKSHHPVMSLNAKEDSRFKDAISVQDYILHSLYCTPILVNDDIYGFLYFDNYLDNRKQMIIRNDLMNLMMTQVSIAISNAIQYDNLIKKNKELHTLDVLKNDFISIVSHELNTPLTTLQGYVSRLRRNLFSDEEDRLDLLGKVETSVRKLIVTTSDIITMSKYNIITQLTKVPTNIREIIDMLKHEIDILSKNRKMQVKIEIEEHLPPVDVNWEAVHLMIYNVVLNAIRFTPDFGNVTIGARRSAFPQEKLDEKESLVIYVQDNGIGIPEKEIENVFKKFYELNEVLSHRSGVVEYKSSGLGLGLSTSARIVELHQGKIWIKSKEGEGTTVYMVLPFKSPEESMLPVNKSETELIGKMERTQ